MEFEAPRVFTTSVYPTTADDQDLSQVRDNLRKFLLSYYENDAYLYRDQLRQNVLVRRYALNVNVVHLLSFNETLGQRLHDEPSVILPIFEAAAKDVADRIVFADSPDTNIPYIQIILGSEANPTSLRDLNSRHVSRLVRIPGIIISASALTSKATKLHLVCKECLHVVNQVVTPGFTTLQLPRRCESQTVSGDGQGSKDCGPDPYVVAHDRSEFIDQQVLKLQESPEMVPVGEVPRNILLTVDRTLTNRFVPGTRCTFVGVYSVYDNNKGQQNNSGPSAVAIRNPYLQVVGFEVTGHNNRGELVFTEQEEQEFVNLSKTPDLFDVFSRSIAPSIYGHDDVKKSLACLLMGGSRRILPDSMRLRGDINVLLMGDPGTAKSQMLKFVEKVAPICIYTSGKGSSAAGLTASVQRDTHTRDFYLEGGAMVLADGGVVCIDEFDKMREDDRVAIHEAMEQQTISIAKAGITTVLNSRTSVLAAANPVEGRYNDNKSPGENIDFQTTILSRFDMIYVIKDRHDEDEAIATHVLNTHRNGGTIQDEVEGEIPIEKMRRYITYCRATCAPTLSKDGADRLSSSFVEFRRAVKQQEAENNERTSVPVTIRQLEALVRISESIAKLHLSTTVEPNHVDEAIRLFVGSTMQALQTEKLSADRAKKVHALEEKLKQKLRVGYGANLDTIRNIFCADGEYTNMELDTALLALERRGTITYRNQGKRVHRVSP